MLELMSGGQRRDGDDVDPVRAASGGSCGGDDDEGRGFALA
jgi:hypothetical protein